MCHPHMQWNGDSRITLSAMLHTPNNFHIFLGSLVIKDFFFVLHEVVIR